jgi:hypothetical protein
VAVVRGRIVGEEFVFWAVPVEAVINKAIMIMKVRFMLTPLRERCCSQNGLSNFERSSLR